MDEKEIVDDEEIEQEDLKETESSEEETKKKFHLLKNYLIRKYLHLVFETFVKWPYSVLLQLYLIHFAKSMLALKADQ